MGEQSQLASECRNAIRTVPLSGSRSAAMRSVAALISEMLRRARSSMICPQAFRRNRRSSECEPPDPEPPAGDPSAPVPTCRTERSSNSSATSAAGTGGRRRSSPTRDGKPPEDPDAAIDCRNRQPTRYQGAAEIVASPDLAWQGANRCKFVTWISAQRCSSRLEPSVRTESFAGPDDLARIQQGARKIGDSAHSTRPIEASN